MNPQLEERLAALEAKVERYEAWFRKFLEGPGKHVAGALGVKLPEPPR